MRYAQTGIRGYAPPEGACPGHAYDDRPDQGDPHMSVNCARCEPWLGKDPLWSSSPATVPLNEDEQREAGEAQADREKRVLENAANTSAAIGGITEILGKLADRLDAMQSPPAVAPAPAAPEVTAPASGAPEPAKAAVKPRSRRAPVGAAV
jgi:hypothetical protein